MVQEFIREYVFGKGSKNIHGCDVKRRDAVSA